MARKGKGYAGAHSQRSNEQLEAIFEENLGVLADLCAAYDDGKIAYVFLIATQLQTILTEGRVAIQRRGKVQFPSPISDDTPNNLAAHYLLTSIEIVGTDPPYGQFQPAYLMLNEAEHWHYAKFSHWWAETVFRASAALPGATRGSIPVNDAPSVPYDERERLSRRLIVQTLRNHRGSHTLDEFPSILDEIDGPACWGEFSATDEATGTIYSTVDGTLKWKAGQLAATIRQIAWEVLVAFGRCPSPNAHEA